MAKREFTEEELSWLEANYHTLTLKDCARHLQISKDLVRKTANKLGLDLVRKTACVPDGSIMPNVIQGNAGYCIDCALYKEGGICKKNGRSIGALHMKSCFKSKG